MPDLAKLSASKLEALTAKRSAVSSALCRQLIDAGFGMERFSDLCKRAAETGDALATAYVTAWNAEHECHSEAESRRRYSGTLKPIKRSN